MVKNASVERLSKANKGDAKRRSVQFPVVPTIDKESAYEHPGIAPSIAETDDGSDEDYDWSTDEDLVDQEAKFEEKLGLKKRQKGWGPRRYFLTYFVLHKY